LPKVPKLPKLQDSGPPVVGPAVVLLLTED
jgi:hypothetical protein